MASPTAPNETSDAATRLAQATAKLTEDQRREVADFAEFLAGRRQPSPAVEDSSPTVVEDSSQAEQREPRRFDTSKLYGKLAHLKDQYASGVELQHAIVREDWGQLD